MQIFSGSSNRGLAEKIAQILGVKLGEMEISRFSNGETRVWVKEKKIEKRVVVVQSLPHPTNEHLIEFCLICDALHRGGATEITAVIPWMGYSKQDKVFRSGEPLSAKVVAQIIQIASPTKIVTFDLHNRATLGFFDVPIVELSAKPLLIEYFRKQLGSKVPNSGPGGEWVVVAPDSGSVKASGSFARELDLPIAYMDKRRDYVSGQVEVAGMSGEVKGKRVIIVDDMIVTGGTVMAAAVYLKSQGALSVSVAATHHLYVPGAQAKLEKSEIDEVVVSDSVAESIKHPKLVVLSIAPIIAEEISGYQRDSR